MVGTLRVCLAVAFIMNGQVFAADEAPPTDEAAAPVAEPATGAPDEQGTGPDMGESEANRQGKIASIVAEGGFAVAPFPMTGAAAGWYAMPDLLAEISHTSGGISIDIVDVKISLTELRAKYFVGNSFYLNAGYGQRKITFDADLEAAGLKVPVSLDATTNGLSFGLGNRWQWSHFSLGCDWIGYFAPLSSEGDTDIDVPGADEKDKKDLEDAVDQLAETPSFQAFRLYLGVSI